MVTPLFVGSWDACFVVAGGMDETGRKPWLGNPCSGSCWQPEEKEHLVRNLICGSSSLL